MNTTSNLAQILRQAREESQLELSDIAAMTHVRKDYLQALEEGHYDKLPEDIYTRNFLRLYAQAVKLDEQEALATYQAERGLPPSTIAAIQQSSQKIQHRESRRPLAAWLPAFLLVAAVVAVAGWLLYENWLKDSPMLAFRSTPLEILPPADTQSDSSAGAATNPIVVNPPASTETGSAEASTLEAETASATSPSDSANLIPPLPAEVRFSLVTLPSGAEVSIDNYVFPGTTPILGAPVTAGEARVLRVSLEGHEVYEEILSLTDDLERTIILSASGGDVGQPESALGVASGQLSFTTEAQTWVEVYQSTERNVGERLVYGTLEAGEARVFDLPVYVHVGNAGGIRLNLGGQDLGLMGSSGEVTGRAFTEP